MARWRLHAIDLLDGRDIGQMVHNNKRVVKGQWYVAIKGLG